MRFTTFTTIILVVCTQDWSEGQTLHGRYTRDVDNYELLVPKKLTHDGKFLTFSIPHFFKTTGAGSKRRKREYEDNGRAAVHYGVAINGKEHHLEVWPNNDLISANAVVEKRNPKTKVKDSHLEKLIEKKHCHYRGRIRGLADSNVAISTCDGLAGNIRIGSERFFIEPLDGHLPNKRGHHLHMVYTRSHKTDNHYRTTHCGTQEDWREAWKKRFRDNIDDDLETSDQKRGLSSAHRYLETLVVADKMFMEHHKNTDMNLYILTIMNMVSNYYQDATVGNQIDLVVVRVMYLEKEEEEIDLAISRDSDKTLQSFCKWQRTVNPKDIKNPNHHDIAVLLTRYDICTDNMQSCGLMGLAYVASACTTDKPCAINEDGGLILSVVVAHEIGHVLGCSHDKEDESGCSAQADDGSYYTMSPYVHLHTNVWSTCSRTFITTFFDNDLGECLNDEPETSLFQWNEMLPGAVYDAKYQCQLDYPGSKVCQVEPDKFCDRLLCRTNPTTCMSSGEPPADGTKCGENKWCYNKKCVEMGQRPEAINGGWGEWSTYGSCSRTCGGGVSFSERECNNPKPQHKGRYCLGERKRVKICNMEPCPEGVPSFRAVQCSEFDKKPFQNKYHVWKPYLKDGDHCSLHCINEDNVYVKFAPRAKDGTKCKAGTKDMCISGMCRVVGCDNVLDSDAYEDDCGVCKGDGTECKLVERTFQATSGEGYVKVAVIFRGCRKVVVEELKPSVNTIAITGPDEKHYYLNGGNVEQEDGVYDMGGIEGVYSHPEPSKEMLVIHGPLKENLVLFVVFYEAENVGYNYKYAEPTSKSNYQPAYHWEFVDENECTVLCGGGVQIAEPKCIEEKNGLVSSSFCQATDKPANKTKKCNEQPCKTKWRKGRWSKCKGCKKTSSGVQTREVECVREAQVAGQEDVLVEDSECTTPRPGTKKLCSCRNNKGKCPALKRGSELLDELPEHMMRKVWMQTQVGVPEIDPKVIDLFSDTRNPNKFIRDLKAHYRRRVKHNNVKNYCNFNVSLETSERPTLKVGTVVDDTVDTESLKLIEIPIKQSHTFVNLTDQSFEENGEPSDTLDMSHEKVYRGEIAAKILKEFAHSNGTSEEST